MNLRKMYDGAVAYYVGEHADINGVIANKQFPVSGPTVPDARPRLDLSSAGKRYPSSPTDWKQGGWAALDFSISRRAGASRTRSSTTIRAAPASTPSASMIANGDQNGNGVYSTFERDMQGTLEGVQGGIAMYTDNETE